ncbi:MAG: endoflagellar basal body L-ring protein, partial [Leptospira sp.]|nr:endoflagellar basal body L-ring protein [Leptospira sp.]
EEDRTVSSDLIANLKLEFQGSVSKEMMEDPEVVIKENQNPDGSITYKAELSEKVKQMLILKNIKRMLGESE